MADLGDDDFADEVPDESQDTKQQASEPERNNMEIVDSSLEITDVEQVATLHSSEKLLNMIKVNFCLSTFVCLGEQVSTHMSDTQMIDYYSQDGKSTLAIPSGPIEEDPEYELIVQVRYAATA